MKRDADSEVINLINLTNMCQTFQCLPREGGVLDQDCYLIIGMQHVLQAQAEKAERDHKAAKS